MRKQNNKLFVAIREEGLTQKDFAKIVGVTPAYVSNVVNGWFLLNERKQISWARALGRPAAEIFPE